MIATLLALMLTPGQTVLRDAGPPAKAPPDPEMRRTVLPGRPEPRLQPIPGFLCRSFVGYNAVQTAFNLQTGDTACSGEVVDPVARAFRQVNYLPTPAGRLMTVIHGRGGPVDARSRIVVLLNGGPRLAATEHPIAARLVAAGYVVLLPLYRGELESRHPEPDLPDAIRQVRALEAWAGDRLVATIGISAGGYLAAAACTARCRPRILLAPLMTSPEEGLSDQRTDWRRLNATICQWQPDGMRRTCAPERAMRTSFWGPDHYRRSLAQVLLGNCARVRIIVSPADQRVYDAAAVAALRSAGCRVETPEGIPHHAIDSDPAILTRLVALVEPLRHGPARGPRRSALSPAP
ncbi:hypothetical protein [Sphingomonas sp. VNH70]|uniref:alpha/beta hydrolase family protein n=1 Tax=Sphingomonas silueang TaxID=3156617 RepID=UPI0032B5D16E